jgi:hypothetical protein
VSKWEPIDADFHGSKRRGEEGNRGIALKSEWLYCGSTHIAASVPIGAEASLLVLRSVFGSPNEFNPSLQLLKLEDEEKQEIGTWTTSRRKIFRTPS